MGRIWDFFRPGQTQARYYAEQDRQIQGDIGRDERERREWQAATQWAEEHNYAPVRVDEINAQVPEDPREVECARRREQEWEADADFVAAPSGRVDWDEEPPGEREKRGEFNPYDNWPPYTQWWQPGVEAGS